MAFPRAVTNSVEAFAVLITDIKQRLSTVELFSHSHKSQATFLMPAGAIVEYVGTSDPDGWFLLDGSIVPDAETRFPELWAVAPAGWKFSPDFLLPSQPGYMVRVF
jgi:hypothetical protein